MKNQQKAILEGLILESLALERELEEYKKNVSFSLQVQVKISWGGKYDAE